MPNLSSRLVTATQRGAPTGVPFHALRHIPILLAGLGALTLCAALSLALGARPVPLSTVADALFGHAQGRDALVVTGLRLPRTVIGLAVGAALGVAGAVAQGITRNPLASPTTLGINAGAGFAVVVAIFALKLDDPVEYVWFAFAGAAGAALLAQALARRAGDIDPVRLALGGTVLQLVLLSWTSAVMLLNQRTLDEARFWLAGSLSGRSLGTLWPVLPTLLLGLLVALAVSPPSTRLPWATIRPRHWASRWPGSAWRAGSPSSCSPARQWPWRARSPSSAWRHPISYAPCWAATTASWSPAV